MSDENIKKSADKIWQSLDKPDKFMGMIENADLMVVRILIARLGSTGSTGARFEALRDGAIAVLQSRLSANQTKALNSLNISTSFLAKVGICVAVIAVLVAIVQIIIALCIR